MATSRLLLPLLLLLVLCAAVSVGGRRRTFGRAVGLAPLTDHAASESSPRGTFQRPATAGAGAARRDTSQRVTSRASRRRDRGPGAPSLPPLRDSSLRVPAGRPQPSSRSSSRRNSNSRSASSSNSLRRGGKQATSSTRQAAAGRRGGVRGSTSQGHRTTAQRPGGLRVQQPQKDEKPKRRFGTPAPNFRCPEPDGAFADDKQCDSFFVCQDGEAFVEQCPDGLVFHPERAYHCVYPVEANCTSTQRAAESTEECPRQFATFKDSSSKASDCGAYVRCVAGTAYPTQCPVGLAFDAATLTCQWADQVDQCTDVEGYVGFRCEQRQFAPEEVGDFTMEAHPSNCTQFYLCVNAERGQVLPRLQTCPDTTVFDPENKECTDQLENVPACADAVNADAVSAYQKRQQAEQERRESRLAELRAKFIASV